jgi:putative AdoMet-dependent methyltransferase
MTMPAQRGAALFERWAAHYDGFVAQRRFPLGAHATVLASMIEHLALRPGERVLELGAGTGLLTARLLTAGAQVIAVDLAPAMLERARARAPSAELRLLDVSVPGWADGLPPVDRVTASYLLHEFPFAQQRALVETAASRLVPDGWMVFGDVGFATPEARDATRAAVGDLWDADEHYWAGTEVEQIFGARWATTYHDCGELGGVITLRSRPAATGSLQENSR